ncbi:MAG: hypothetical protein QXX55_01170 [Candidatus Pacearchaeota archaeon]
MKILKSSDLEEAIKYMNIARDIAKGSPCKKEKEGAIIVKNNSIVGMGINKPPYPFICEPDYCGLSCKIPIIHAEMSAIMNVKYKENLKGSFLYHAKIKENGRLENSKGPSCIDCSKHILSVEISGVVLKHKEGYLFYDSIEYYKINLNNHFKKSF